LTADITTDEPVMLGPYRLEGLLGRGGMGEVYRAFDTRRGRTVALKLLPPDVARDENFRARFRRESDSAACLQDPHVIPIHDFGECDGRLYIDMRLVDGTGLDQIIAAGRLDPRRAVALIAQVAEALTDAHSHGVLHRDVKPSNILVTRSDFAYLVDFGIARALDDDLTALTRSGATIGTLAYMAPERFDGGPHDNRSDIYSLTCTLAECLTGRRPFDATSLPSLMKAHLTADPPRPSLQRTDIPSALDDVIARGMAKDPSARYPTARDLAAAAQFALHPLGTPSAPIQRVPTPKPATLVGLPSFRRQPRLLALAASAILLVAASTVTGFALGHSTGATSGEPSATADEIVSEPIWNLPTVEPNVSSTAEEIVSELASKIASAEPSVSFTADTDPNNLLGRPNGYTSKASFTDSRIEPDDILGAEPGSVDAGGSVEVFASADAAAARQRYIQQVQTTAPFVGTEYSYLDGTALVRVSGKLTPDQAADYERVIEAR
jgi:serine/threonine-protein kinase